MKYSRLLFTLAAFTTLALTACKKNNYVVDNDEFGQPAAFVKFNVLNVGDTTRTLYVSATNNKVIIPVGITDVQNVDRTVTIELTSTSAQNGVHYTAPTSVTIPAGEAVANFEVTADVATYASGRVDEIRAVITGGDVPVATYQKAVRITLRPDCNEGNPTLVDLEGDYANTHEDLSGSTYGPYTVTVEYITPAGTTTAIAGISNIYDTGWGAMEFDMDWTDANNRTVIVKDQDVPNSDAGDLSSTYAGYAVAVRPHASMSNGTYSYCSQTWVLTMQLGISGLGYFNNTYRLDLAR
jgi:hypothetical protein